MAFRQFLKGSCRQLSGFRRHEARQTVIICAASSRGTFNQRSHGLHSELSPRSVPKSVLVCPGGPSCLIPAVVRNYAKGKHPRSNESTATVKKRRARVVIKGPMTIHELATAADIPKDGIYELILERELRLKLDPNTVLKVNLITSMLDELYIEYHLQLHKHRLVIPKLSKDAVRRPPAKPSEMVPRPAVVTVMGHVDHGKTTLLDALRKTSVVAQEAGGITQHIGAFQVPVQDKLITFLDTPGHAAFKAMRERGANVTDMVVLVVAADDGVMKQTKESIQYAQKANVPMIVAINKCDKRDADPDFTKKDLLANDIVLEEFGGSVQAVEISALKGLHLDDLTEAIITQAEVQELKADPSGAVEALIIESRVDKGKGSIATAIIQRGTLKRGAILVAGEVMCKVRQLLSESGQVLKSAGPSLPVEITGWKGVPSAGDLVLEVKSESRAREVLKWRLESAREEASKEEGAIIEKKAAEHRQALQSRKALEMTLHWREVMQMRDEERYSRQKESAKSGDPELNVVIKADVDGSVEAILDVLSTYNSHQQCKLEIVKYGVGIISEKDVELAQSFEGIVYGFNVDVSSEGKAYADEHGVHIKHHQVIYKLVDDLKEELALRLPPKEVEELVGEATVIQPFSISVGKRTLPVAGCRVNKGQLLLNGGFRLLRNNEKLHEGKLDSLKHHKEDVSIVTKDMECGVMFRDIVDYRPGDTILCYEIRQEPQTVDWKLDF